MIQKIEPELIDDSFFLSLNNNFILIQDKSNKDIEKQIISNNIVKKQIEYIKNKNKYFFFKFEKLYTSNIILKSKLNDVQSEKKKLNQIIFKLEQKLKNSKPINNEKGENGFIMNNNNVNIIEPYRKKKRKRRKKKDIQNIYNCPFNNCNKSYPSKGSLNMHIKLKHQNQNNFTFDNIKK